MEVGDSAAPYEVGPITLTDIVRYQGASGDFNAIHHDPDIARAAGHLDVVSVGMLQAGILAAYATDSFGPEHVRRFRVRFRELVFVGDRFVCHGKVVRKYRRGGQQLVDLELGLYGRTGELAVEGTATFLVP
jgi:acyl dehydratase